MRDQHSGCPVLAFFRKGGYGDAGIGEAAPPESLDRDRVQVIRAIAAMLVTAHYKSPRIGSIVPALAKNARTGHPRFRNGERNQNY